MLEQDQIVTPWMKEHPIVKFCLIAAPIVGFTVAVYAERPEAARSGGLKK
jgi:hypothetical protein